MNAPAYGRLLTIAIAISACDEAASAPIPQLDLPAEVDAARGAAAFTNVNVISMEDDQPRTGQTVLVRDGRIAAVGAVGEVVLDPDVTVLDASGTWLMPGLIDMHVHNSSEQDGVNDLTIYLANGVTSIRFMWGSSTLLRWRQLVREGTLRGPAIYTVSPGMDGPGAPFSTPITSPEEARELVALYAAAGYDALKVYNSLTPDVFTAIHDEARMRNIDVVGHTPARVPFATVLNEGQWTNEHLLGYERATALAGSFWVDGFDEQQVRSLAELELRMGVAESPTLVVQGKSARDIAQFRAEAAARYMSDGMLDWFERRMPPWPGNLDTEGRMRRLRDLTRLLHQLGVPIVLGTDAGVRWTIPGFSIHEELGELVRAGLSPYEALRAGTVVAAAYLDEQDLGTITVGSRADLLLVAGNPLDDVANANRRIGVMAAGRWTTDERFKELLEEIAAGYGR